jgi:subtilase family serine protease
MTHDPKSTNYHQYLTPQQFTERFGPTEQDYKALIEFAKANGLTVVGTHPNRMLLDIKASVADIEKASHVTMRLYQHPMETRTFYAPDVEPSLDLAVPVLHISGLDNYVVPRRSKLKPVSSDGATNVTCNGGSGSGPYGGYMAKDIRAAYVPGVLLDGSGQSVGLLEFDGYYPIAITEYESSNNLPNVTLTDVLLDGFGGTNYSNGEVEWDIEMAIAMAPGLSSVIVYEIAGTNIFGVGTLPPDDLLNRMATDNLAKQLSSSWDFNLSSNSEQIFQEFAAQGQSFFQSSGDSGCGDLTPVQEDPYITIVGGTELTMTTNGGAWVSETTWNLSDGSSGGGISTIYAIPWWQQGIDMSANGGSTTMRNMPDVAMVADEIYCFWGNTPGSGHKAYGTSLATPLWAGFMALVNQQLAQAGLPSAGLINPAIYAIGKGPNYASCFHDITTGSNCYQAVSGYDLCTGWGTPNGRALIDYLTCPGGVVWVQFGNSNPGDGTYNNPYNTLARGTNGVPSGGMIIVKGPGASSETMTIAKPMTITAIGGAAAIGH